MTALCIVVRKYVAVGDPLDGYIFLPPRANAGEPGLQPWVWDVLERNARTIAGARVSAEG